jgi:uncharacterized protein (TIGR00255 family)
MAKSAGVNSMTGFSRREGGGDGYRWTWEVKSVNSRNLDLRFRLPPGSDELESRARALAPARFTRGNVSVHLSLQRPDRARLVQVNRDALDQMLALAAELKDATDGQPVGVAGLLGLPGVLEPVSEEEESTEIRDARNLALIDSLAEAFDALVAARAEEGARLVAIMGERLAEIETHRTAAEALASNQPAAAQQRLRDQIDQLLGAENPLSEERLAQEVALIVARGDVREELDRLAAHVASAHELIGEGGAIGRRLDFLCQEFNREANTLCSKSSDLELTRIGLDLKAAVERLREQVQNVE